MRPESLTPRSVRKATVNMDSMVSRHGDQCLLVRTRCAIEWRRNPIVLGFLLIACIVMMLPAPATPAPGSPSPSTSEIDATLGPATAAVTVDGEILFRVRGITAYPAERRAPAIAARIEAIGGDRSVSTQTLRIEEAGDKTNILAGDRLIMSVFDADAGPEGVSRQILAEVIRTRVIEAIGSYRHDRSSRVLLINTLYALGATVVAVLLFGALRRGFRWLETTVERRFKSRIEGLQAKSFHIIQAEGLWTALRNLLTSLHLVSLVVLGYAYLNLVLGLYPWTRPLAHRLFAIFLDPLRTMGTAFLNTLPNLAFLAILILVTRYALGATRLFFAGIDRGRIRITGFERDWAMPTYRIARLLIIAFAVVMAYPHIPGSQSDAFKGISIFLGVVFSLGSSSVIANMIAGYTMTYRRAFKLGDRIRVDDIMGDVVEMRLLVTHLRTIKNEEVIVPNSLILNSHVINYSTLAKSRGLILHTTVGIGYEVSWRQVEAMLQVAAERTPGLLKEPSPYVLQKSLGDFAVTYELNAYCDNPQAMPQLYTALHQNILDVFNEHSVQIMTPAYENDPQTPKVVPKDQWFAAPAKSPTRPLGT